MHQNRATISRDREGRDTLSDCQRTNTKGTTATAVILAAQQVLHRQTAANMQIIIEKEADRARALYLIEEAPLLPVLVVTVDEYVENRSAAQRRLQWLWCTEIANYTGDTKEAVHDRYKERFAVPIFTRDDAGYAAMVEAVKNVRRAGMVQDADSLKRKILALTSTSDFSVKQNTEYLHEIEMEAARIGVAITFPEEIYNTAMGRKKRGEP